MDDLASFRKKNPDLAGVPDYVVADAYARVRGVSDAYARVSLGMEPRNDSTTQDFGTDLKSGIQQVPGAAAGLLDIPFAATMGARPFTRAANALGEITGFEPGKWANESQGQYSENRLAAQRDVKNAWDSPTTGAIDILQAYGRNPALTVGSVVQSLPGMAVGGVVGRGAALAARGLGLGVREAAVAEGAMGPGQKAFAPWVGPTAAGIGEGSISAGQQMSQYDPNLPDQERNALASAGVGLGVGLIGAGAGALARKMGIEDIQTTMATGRSVDLLNLAARPSSMLGRVGKGVLQEGLFEEAPQSAIEQAGQNYANYRPLTEGMARASVEGGIAGSMLGGAFNLRTNRSRADWQRDVSTAQAVLSDPTADPELRQQAGDFLTQVAPRFQPPGVQQNRRDAQYQGYISPLQEQAGLDNTQFDTRNQIEQELAAQGTAGGAQGAGTLLTPRPGAAPTAAPAPIASAGSIQLVNGVPTLVPAAPAAPAAPVIPRLTPDLSRATPRYSGSTLEFPDDVHKAAYIIGKETTKSKRDAEYLGFVMNALGVDESTARAYGRQINAALKTVTPVGGRITVPTVQFTPAAQQQGAPAASGQAVQVESDAEKIQRLRMRPKPDSLTLDPNLPIDMGAQWMLHDFETEGALAERVHDWRTVAKQNGLPGTDFLSTVAALKAKLGAPDGNDGQSVRTGGIPALKTQDGAGEAAVVIPGQAAQPPVSGTTGEGVEAEEAITKRLDASLNSEAAPRRGNAPTVAGRKPLDEAGVQFVAKALRQSKSGEDEGATGPYARLHDALTSWNRMLSKAGSAKSEEKQNKYYPALAASTRGEAGSMDAVVPLLQAMEDEFGTDSVNKVVAAIKGRNEKVGGKEISPHVRLAASWNMYKKGTLTANEGVSAGSDTTVRDNKRTEAFARELADMGIDMGSSLEQATLDNGAGPLAKTETKRNAKGRVTEKASWKGERSGIMRFLSNRGWQGFTADHHAVAQLLYEFFDKTGNPPTIVFSKEDGKNAAGRPVGGHYSYKPDSHSKTGHTVTIYKNGNNIRTVLHELLHAATVKYLYDHWGNKTPSIGYLENTLVTMAKLHGKAWAEFSKDLDAGTKARLEAALRNTAELHRDSNGNPNAQLKAVAEFITYGQTDPDFQAYMRHLKIPKIESPFQLDKKSYVNAKSGKLTTPSNAGLTVWSRFTNAMSWITTGKAFNKEATSLMDQFLSDSGNFYKELFTEGAAATTAAPAPAAPTNKAAPAQAPPTKAAPAATPGIRARLKVGDLVMHRDSRRTAVVKTAEDGDGFVRVQYNDAAKEYGDTAPLTRLKAEYLVPEGTNEGFNAEAPAPDEEITGEETVLRGNINSAVIVDMVGQQMYDNAKIAGLTAAKELFQNAVDALKGAIEKGLIKEGKVAITIDETDRTVEIKDNGVGMSFETVQKAFFTLGGTEKPTERPSGGFGIAKIQFLSAASKIWLTTVRDGVKVVVETTGADVRRTMSAFGGDPENTKFPADQIKRFKTSDPNGTTVKVKMPETSTDDDGIVTKVEMPKYWTPIPAIEYSPVLENIEVTWNGDVLPIGKNFPKDKFVPLKTIVMPAWGEADILVSKEQVEYTSQKVVHVLSYGVWQFDTIIKPPGAGMWDPAIPYEVFINIRSKVKAQSPSYPIGRSREAFTAKGEKDMARVRSMIGAMFGFRETIKHVTDYGMLKVVRPDGRIEDSVSLVPEVSDAVKAEALLIPDNANVTVVDGRLMIDGKSIPEMTKAEIEAYKPPDIGQFKIDQDLLNPNDQLLQEGLEYRVTDANGNETWVKPSVYGKDKFGKRFGGYLASLGGVMKTIREQVASLPGFEGAEKIPIGHLFGSEKLYGTHSNIPFRAVLVNPAIASILPESNRGDASTMGPGGSDASVENVAMGMIGTTVHEFAHYRAGDHGYDFMATMQNLFGELTINDPVGFVRAIQAMNKVIKDYKDIYDDLNQKPDSERRLFGNPIKGSSETDGRANNRTDNTELSERSGGDRSNRRTDRKDNGAASEGFDSEAPASAKDAVEAIELKNRMSPKYKGGGGWNVKDGKLAIGARVDYNGREYRVVSRKDDPQGSQLVKMNPSTAPFGLTGWVRSDTLKKVPPGPKQGEISFDAEAPEVTVNEKTGNLEIEADGKVVHTHSFATPKFLAAFKGDGLDNVVRQRSREAKGSQEFKDAFNKATNDWMEKQPLNAHERRMIAIENAATNYDFSDEYVNRILSNSDGGTINNIRRSLQQYKPTKPSTLTDQKEIQAAIIAAAKFKHGDEGFDSEVPALPTPGQALDPETIPDFNPRYQRTSWFGAFAGWTAGVDRAGHYAAAKTEDFAKAFPRAANVIRYFDWQFGLPQNLINSWTYTKLKSNPPKHRTNALAAVMRNMPEADQQAIMNYMDGNAVEIEPHAKILADEFKTAFRQLLRDYVTFATMKDDARDALRTKIDTAKISDLLIYVRDQKDVGSSGMSTVPLGHFLSDNRSSIDRANVFGLPNALEGRFFRIMEKLPTGPQGEMRSYVSGFVHEALADQHQAGSNETVDRTTGWFLKGPDPTISGHLVFTSNVSYAEANRYSKLATHGSAMQHTVDKLERIVSSERFAQGTIKFGQQAGLVYDSREALAAVHPRMSINAPTVLTIRNVGDIDSLSYAEQNKLRQSDQWVHVPEGSRAYGTMAGMYVNGSVWAALQDIHHNQPVINIPAYNTVIRWFKKNKTVFSPGTHIVNIGSNLSWMYLHDIPANSVGEGVRLYYKVVVSPQSLTPPEKALWNAFIASGAMIADHSSVELRKILSVASVEALGNKPSLWGDTEAMAMYERAKASAIGQYTIKYGKKGKDAALWFDNFAQELYAAEDNAFRLAAFMSKASSLQASKGGAKLTEDELMEAGKAAATEFLDYNIHARAINVMKQTILPFISWPYRAIPAFMTVAVRQPWKVAGLVSALALIDAMAVAMTGGDEEDKRKRKALPTYMNDRLFGYGPHMYIQVPGLGTSNKPVYFKLGGFVPLGDLIQGEGRNPLLGQKWFPAQFTPNGPLISALAGAVFNVDPFTGQPINKSTDSQWGALKKRAIYMEGQLAPPALDIKKGVEKWDRIVNDKRGPLGHEFSTAMQLGSLVGIRLVQIDVAEAAFTQSRAVKAIEMEYKKELASVTREALRFPNRKAGELEKTKAAVRERMKEEIDRVKNKGD